MLCAVIHLLVSATTEFNVIISTTVAELVASLVSLDGVNGKFNFFRLDVVLPWLLFSVSVSVTSPKTRSGMIY